MAENGFRVRAIRPGFIHSELKPVGSEFTLPSLEWFSKTWMQKLDPEPLEEAESDEPDEGGLETAPTRRRRRVTQ
jgi:hypothetical protein